MVQFDIPALTSAFIGGLLISLASTINLLFKGRITGMSSIIDGIVQFDSTVAWKSSLLSGLLFASSISYYFYGFEPYSPNSYFFDSPKVFSTGNSHMISLIAGFLVGLGTKIGNGCTSGHGVCGLPRFSKRSFVAVMTFMATGILMANLKEYIISPTYVTEMKYDPSIYVRVFFMVSVSILIVNFATNKNGSSGFSDIVVSFIVGLVFGVGLLYSGMTRRSKVLGFLTFDANWDPSLMAVMGGAVMLNLITFNFIIKVLKKPLLAESLSIPTNTQIDAKLVGGAALFGLGWGLGGICPGPAMVVAPIYFPMVMMFFAPGMIAGQFLGGMVSKAKVKQN